MRRTADWLPGVLPDHHRHRPARRAATRVYGVLIPAGILTGLGFIAIYAVHALMTGTQRRWWPLIPGAILVTIAVANGALGAPLLVRARPRQTG